MCSVRSWEMMLADFREMVCELIVRRKESEGELLYICMNRLPLSEFLHLFAQICFISVKCFCLTADGLMGTSLMFISRDTMSRFILRFRVAIA